MRATIAVIFATIVLLLSSLTAVSAHAQLGAQVVDKPKAGKFGATLHSVVLNWHAPASTAASAPTGYNVKRGGVTIGATTATVLTFTDTSTAVQAEGSSFTYTVTATNTAGESGPSNPQTVTIPITIVAPNPPSLDPPVVN